MLVLTLKSLNLFSQATAYDFTAAECQGNSHHLFDELDAGKVVILEFFMLNCAPCIVATKALENITQPYQNSHPGRVHIYSFGFLNSYTCDQILGWKNDNEFSHPVFDDGEDQVDYYGGMGMPTLVVIGTNEHKVFFKSIGYTSAIDDEITQAIDSALLYNPTGVGEPFAVNGFRIYPTLVTDQFYVELSDELPGSEIILFDAFGREVLTLSVMEKGRTSIPVTGLSRGVYVARLRQNIGLSAGVRLIVQ
jgi:thiol-disulfide isomerase/thioredoxin